ncbi:hypothetical protein [Parasitella parasitica]|uniref:Uncharacterized protein n=1 Tax=Parasitella parasitica TaxID=35722 RepID=A0A0B7NRR3_9FUNG|nr:hypothetical protein [Parasitella parasitica]
MSSNDIELTKQGIKWRAKNFDENLAADLQPCAYEVKFTSKYKDMKEPQPFNKDFFDNSNVEMEVIAKCPKNRLLQDSVKDVKKFMIDYDDLSPEQKLIVDYRRRIGYYKPIIVSKGGWAEAGFREFLMRAGQTAYAIFIINRISAFLFKRYFLHNIQIENEQ